MVVLVWIAIGIVQVQHYDREKVAARPPKRIFIFINII